MKKKWKELRRMRCETNRVNRSTKVIRMTCFPVVSHSFVLYLTMCIFFNVFLYYSISSWKEMVSGHKNRKERQSSGIMNRSNIQRYNLSDRLDLARPTNQQPVCLIWLLTLATQSKQPAPDDGDVLLAFPNRQTRTQRTGYNSSLSFKYTRLVIFFTPPLHPISLLFSSSQIFFRLYFILFDLSMRTTGSVSKTHKEKNKLYLSLYINNIEDIFI